LKNVKEALSQLYLILRDLEKAASQSSSSEFGGMMGVKRTHSGENLGGEVREQLLKVIKRETHEMFGIFPPRDAIDSKIILTSFEIVRIH
jgi:hypothetical protein